MFLIHRFTWIKYHKNTIIVEKHSYKPQNERKGRKEAPLPQRRLWGFLGLPIPKPITPRAYVRLERVGRGLERLWRKWRRGEEEGQRKNQRGEKVRNNGVFIAKIMLPAQGWWLGTFVLTSGKPSHGPNCWPDMQGWTTCNWPSPGVRHSTNAFAYWA